MTVQERRQHFRIDDQLYFDYRIIDEESYHSEQAMISDLLGKSNQQYMETSEYFQSIERELNELTQNIALKDPAIAHYLNLINTKIDFLTRQLLVGENVNMRHVNLSLGGIAFKDSREIPPDTRAKLLIYTKPKMTPIIVNAICVHCQSVGDHKYRIAMKFESLNHEQEELLSQHIMLAQIRYRVSS